MVNHSYRDLAYDVYVFWIFNRNVALDNSARS